MWGGGGTQPRPPFWTQLAPGSQAGTLFKPGGGRRCIVQLRARVVRKFSPFPELLATNDALEFALGFPTGGPHVRDAFSGQNALELAASRCSLSAQSSGPPNVLAFSVSLPN